MFSLCLPEISKKMLLRSSYYRFYIHDFLVVIFLKRFSQAIVPHLGEGRFTTIKLEGDQQINKGY